IRRVRIVQMNPAEKRLVACRQPLNGGGDDFRRPPFRVFRGSAGLSGKAEAIVIKIKSAIQSETGGQHVRAHKSRRAVTAGLQKLRDGGNASAKNEGTVVPHTVRGRISSGEDADMRRECQRDGGRGALENYAVPRDPIQVSSLDVPVAIRAEPVSP